MLKRIEQPAKKEKSNIRPSRWMELNERARGISSATTTGDLAEGERETRRKIIFTCSRKLNVKSKSNFMNYHLVFTRILLVDEREEIPFLINTIDRPRLVLTRWANSAEEFSFFYFFVDKKNKKLVGLWKKFFNFFSARFMAFLHSSFARLQSSKMRLRPECVRW